MSNIWSGTRMPKSGYQVVDLQLRRPTRGTLDLLHDAVKWIYQGRKKFKPIFQKIKKDGDTVTDMKRLQYVDFDENLHQSEPDNSWFFEIEEKLTEQLQMILPSLEVKHWQLSFLPGP